MTISEKPVKLNEQSLSNAIESMIKNHLKAHDKDIVDLYKLVIEEVEEPLYKCAIEHCRYNRSRAAAILGVSRGTLRSRLKHYFDDQYVGTRN